MLAQLFRKARERFERACSHHWLTVAQLCGDGIERARERGFDRVDVDGPGWPNGRRYAALRVTIDRRFSR
jgi:hypothetical protein